MMLFRRFFSAICWRYDCNLSGMVVLHTNDSDDLTAARPAIFNMQNSNQSDFGLVTIQ